jgi:hypothetical protein
MQLGRAIALGNVRTLANIRDMLLHWLVIMHQEFQF